MKIKLIVGFRRDQEHSIDASEAHKAYYLFLHPEARGVFSNGLAIKGDQIQEIVPDWQGTMGWNPTHNLDSNDWNEMQAGGIPMRLRSIIGAAKDIAQIGNTEDLNVPIQTLLEGKYAGMRSRTIEARNGATSSIKELLQANR